MAQVIVTESSLENIGDAIRAKLGTSDTYKPAEMAGAIAQIHGEPVLEALSVTENGTYDPSSGKDGFSQAVVNVPNSYAAGDEGKVVSNGALVAQTSDTVTENGTYDTTLKNQITVNVSGGGGGQQINPFTGSTVSLYHSTNVSVTDSSVDNDGTMEMECAVTASNVYEGFNIELNNLVANTPYEIDFDFQFINAGFYNSYGRGYKVTATADTNYSSYSSWERNLDADNNKHSEKCVFIATATKMYLSFNISDLQNGSPSFEITNFKVKTFGGGSSGVLVLSGTSTPSDNIGNDGNLYCKIKQVGFTCDPAYYVDSTSQLLATHSVAFYKTYNEPSIAVHYKNNPYYGPLLVGLTENAVKYTNNTTPLGSAVIDGITWYLSKGEYWNTSTDSPSIPTMYDLGVALNTSNISTIISAILQASNARAVDTYIINNTYLKVDGHWQELIGSDIDDIEHEYA